MYKEVKGKKEKKGNIQHTNPRKQYKARDYSDQSRPGGWTRAQQSLYSQAAAAPPIFPSTIALFFFYRSGWIEYIYKSQGAAAAQVIAQVSLERLLCCRTEDNRRGGYVRTTVLYIQITAVKYNNRHIV